LEAAGGHSYSDDPLFWLSSTPPSPPPPPPPPPSGPQILGTSIFRPGGGTAPIEMGERYRLQVRVVEMTPILLLYLSLRK
jgi:hypothetical protein